MGVVPDDSTNFENKKILSVFSHPNHELAIYGTLSRFRSRSIFLTRTYSTGRREETIRGLESAGCGDKTRFLGYSEEEVYRSLVAGNRDVLVGLTEAVAEAMAEVNPDVVLCDAVEFFNPVHDLVLPLVLRARALCGLDCHIYEVPLLSQPEEHGCYAIQVSPEGREHETLRVVLTDAEAEAKLEAARTVYVNLGRILMDEAGIDVQALAAKDIRTEFLLGPVLGVPAPKPGNGIRYEWRGEALRKRGEITEVITYRDHYLPMAAAILDGTARG